jgi:hypothetical protein
LRTDHLKKHSLALSDDLRAVFTGVENWQQLTIEFEIQRKRVGKGGLLNLSSLPKWKMRKISEKCGR